MKSFRDLIVWQKSVDFVTEIYSTTKEFPDEEKYGLSSQIRRASVSIPSNVAEGFGRKSDGDFARFLSIAIGSSYEVQTQIEIAQNIGFMSNETRIKLLDMLEEVERMLKSLKSKVKKT